MMLRCCRAAVSTKIIQQIDLYMSLCLYSTAYPEQLDLVVYSRLVDRLPPKLQAQVLAYRRWQDSYGSLFGKLLLDTAMSAAGETSALNRLAVTSYGRPYVKNAPDFNLSHSGHRVICALSTTGRVGIDLEVMVNMDFSDFMPQFTALEWTIIRTADKPLTAFYHHWTAKECLIKADGRGLQIALDSLDVNAALKDGIVVDGTFWHLYTLDHFPGYACHLASDQPIDIPPIREISPGTFLPTAP